MVIYMKKRKAETQKNNPKPKKTTQRSKPAGRNGKAVSTPGAEEDEEEGE